jgi:predicted phage-related endonuclease
MEIEESPFIFQSREHPFMGANLDGLIRIDAERPLSPKMDQCRGLGVHEIKTSQDGYGFGEDEIPDTYYAQVQHYMSVLDLPWAILTAYIISKNKIRHYPVMRDEEFIALMVKSEKEFVENYLDPGVMPGSMGLDAEEDMITGMFQGGQSTIVLGDTERGLCADYTRINAEIKEAEERKKAISNDLKALLVQKAQPGQEMKISATAGTFNISWTRYETTRLDTDAIKKAGLYERYSKKTESGMFRVTEKKAG